MSLLPNPVSYLDRYGCSNMLAISSYMQIVREVTPLLRTGLGPRILVQAGASSVCRTVVVWSCLCISYVQRTEHVSLGLGGPGRRTTFGMDRSVVLWVTAAVMILGRGWEFHFPTSSSMGTLCRRGKAMTHLGSVPGFSPCVSPSFVQEYFHTECAAGAGDILSAHGPWNCWDTGWDADVLSPSSTRGNVSLRKAKRRMPSSSPAYFQLRA